MAATSPIRISPCVPCTHAYTAFPAPRSARTPSPAYACGGCYQRVSSQTRVYPALWVYPAVLSTRRPAALVLSAACKETQCLPSSKGPPSHPGSSPRCLPLPQPPQHPLHALLPPHQPPSPAAHDPPSAPTHFRRTAHAVSAPPPPRPAPPLPRPRFKIKEPPALAPSPSSSTYCILAPTKRKC